MRILHTSDWHLGKTLENINRIEEQRQFIDELCEIAERDKVELVLVAGDIFDTYNPSTAAEELFYDAVDRLNAKGARAVVIIAGNHDSPDRLCAASPLAYKNSIVLLGYPGSIATIYKGHTSVLQAGPGWLEIKPEGAEHSAVIITLPYPSEARLEQLISADSQEDKLQQAYSEKIVELLHTLSGNFRADTVNLIVSHLYLRDGKTSDSERQLGGAMMVDPSKLPDNAHFVALGHLHRPQRIKSAPSPTYYSGSPIAYSFSETDYSKLVYIVDAVPGKGAEIREIYLNSGKPLKQWRAKGGIEEAMSWCEEGRDLNAWIDLEIHTDRALTIEEQRRLRELNPGIINIRPVVTDTKESTISFENREGKKVEELFKDYYRYRTGMEAAEEMLETFLEVVNGDIEAEPEEMQLGGEADEARYLEVEGLQSFKEEQHIDFDKLGETGLFGIFGPTGSGKSTILDALTLALYGNVHRANRGTQGIINMSSPSVRVSFTFDLQKAGERKTYRVERQYRRKKDSENSIESRVARLIELGPSGELVIADKQGEVNESVIDLIGLQFDDFTRSVVLPQNKFQEFLLSAKADKTKMLERIFYLEEYGRELMDKVNRKLSRIRNKLSGIEGALSMLGDISEAALTEAKTALLVSAGKRKSIDEALKAKELEYNSAKEVWELTAELQEAIHKQEELLKRAAEIEAMRSRCKNALAAEGLKDRINELEKTEIELKVTKQELDRLTIELEELLRQLEESKDQLSLARTSRQERIPILVEHRTKLAKALQTKRELEEMEEVLKKLRSEYALLKKQLDHWEENITGLKSKLAEALEYLSGQKSRIETLKVESGYRDKVQKGAVLEEELERAQKTKQQQKSRYEELLSTIRVQEQELVSLEETGVLLCGQLEKSKAAYEQHKEVKQWDRNDIIKAETRYYGIKAIIDAMKLKDKDKELLEARLPEYDRQLGSLESKIAMLSSEKTLKDSELEKLRLILEETQKELLSCSAFSLSKSLQNNEPCPVCGATVHPSPAAHSEGVDTTAIEEMLMKTRASAEKLESECRALENEGIKLAEQHNNLRSQKETLAADIRSKQVELAELADSLPDGYRELSVTLIEKELELLSGEKQEKLKGIEEWETKLSAFEGIQKKADSEYNLYQIESSGKRSQLEANRKHLVELEKAYREAEAEFVKKQGAYSIIAEALGVKSLGSELQRLQSNDQEAEGLYKELLVIESNIAELRKEIEKAEEAKRLEAEKLSENVAEGRGFKYRKEEKEKEIQALPGGGDIAAEITRTEEELTALEKAEQIAQEHLNTVREKYEKTLKDKTVQEKQRDMHGEKLGYETRRLEIELKDKGFASIEEVQHAFIHKDKLEEQETVIKEYEEISSNTKAQREVIEKKLSGRSITEELWLENSNKYQELKLEKENSIAAYESARNRFETISTNYEKWLSLSSELKEHSKKKEHLELFKNLLKGNAFIEYISEERLRYIAKEASETLGVLTRHRYGLELDTENGFIIRDDANGGLRRLVTTLSGGETFLTSLALALALSSQIQLKGQSPLEFFFLDEGFGTLDSSLLDTVIDSLERLSTKERVIGLISHVPEMKARIRRRLVVEAPVINGAGSRVYMEKA